MFDARARARVQPGDTWAGIPVSAQRSALSDLSAPPPADLLYGAELIEATRRFQRRHGLDDDGLIGRNTRAALQVPPGQRVRQLELALERLRRTECAKWRFEPGQPPFVDGIKRQA